MRIRRFAAGLGAIAVAAALLSGCTPSDDDAAGIRVNGSEPANPLIPGDTDELGGFRILQALFAGLVAYDESGAAVDDVAQSIEPNVDNTVFTVTIRKGTTFTDGEEVTSHSFVDAWDWTALTSNGAINQHYFSDFLGFSDEVDSSLIEAGGLVVIDNDTFEVHLTKPHSDFRQLLGHPVFSPLPRVFFDDPLGFAAHPIGNGPYEFDGADAWKHGSKLELIANDDYDGEREAENAGITMIMYDTLDIAYADLLSGHLDVLDTLPASALGTYKDELDERFIDQPLAVLESITIPAGLAHFSGPEGVLRRTAISMAFDRAPIAEDAFGVTRDLAEDFATPSLTTFQEEIRGSEAMLYSKDAAEDAWADANVLSPWEGTFLIAYNVDGGHQEWVDAIAAKISSTLGIDAAGDPYPSYADLQTAIDDGKVVSAYRTVTRADYPSVAAFIGRYAGASAANSGKYLNADFDALLLLGSKAANQSDARAAYSEAQSILLTDLPSLPLWNTTVQAGFGGGVEDVVLDWHGVPMYDAITRSGG
jgi:oligopeptide transport system substrate-binding protein